MKIEELLANLNFSLVPYGPNTGKMQITPKPTAEGKRLYNEITRGMWKAEIAEIKANLIAERDAERAAAAAKQAKIDAIEGLKEIHDALEAQADYYRAFDRMMEDENNDGVCPPKRPTGNIAELKAKYPRAAAYIAAEKYSNASNYAKAIAGDKALEKIINGEDYVAALAAMEKEWSDHVNEHMWD